MIYQYFYGREKDGYQRQSGIKELGLTAREMEPLDTFAVYRTPGRLNEASLPECFYFYNARLERKTIGIVGKTSKVNAQASQISGDRDTSFFHKYIFEGDSYKELWQDPSKIFQINRFCTKLDDISDYDEKDQDIFFKEAIKQDKTKEVLPSLLDVLAFFGLSGRNQEEAFYRFLYGILSSEYKTGCKFYIILPENTKKATDYAKLLLEYIYKELPDFFIKNLGFTTYSVTFHDAISNALPLDVSIAFTADSDTNKKRYSEIAKEHFLFVPDKGLLNEIAMDDFTYNMIRRIGDGILNGTKVQELNLFFQMFSNKITKDSPLSPESLSAAYEFYQIVKGDKSHKKGERDQEFLYQVLKQFFSVKIRMSAQLEQDFQLFLTKYLESFDSSNYILNVSRHGKTVSAAYYNRYGIFGESSLKIMDLLMDQFPIGIDGMIRFLAQKIKSETEKNKLNEVELILNYNYATDLPNVLVHYLYTTPEYYGVASKMVSESLESVIISDKYSSKEKIDKICRGIATLSKQYMGLLTSSDYIAILENAFEEILLRKEPVNYNDILYFRQKLGQTADKYAIAKEYKILRDSIVENSIQAIQWDGDVDQRIVDQLSHWDKHIFEQVEAPLGQRVLERLVLEEYYKQIIGGSVEEIVDFLENRPMEEFCAMKDKIDWKHNEILEQLNQSGLSHKIYYYEYLLLTGFDSYKLLKTVVQTKSVEQTAILLGEMEQLWKEGFITIEAEDLTREVRMAMVSQYQEGEMEETGEIVNKFIEKFGLEDLKAIQPAPVAEKNKLDLLLGKITAFGKKK